MGKRRREMQFQEAMVQRKKSNSLKSLLFVVYVIFGVYLLDSELNFFAIPEFISKLNGWILIIAGILLIFSSLKFLRRK